MPRAMTPDEAARKICPFMTKHNVDDGIEPIGCASAGCACWGWVDPERGEVDFSGSDEKSDVEIDTGAKKPNPPDGDDWLELTPKHLANGKTIYRWARRPIKGPRRGQCEAMSPYIEVVGS